MSDGQLPELDEVAGSAPGPRGEPVHAGAARLGLPLPGRGAGLHEVADLPPAALQDPIWLRTQNTKKGRDGTRVPLPWTAEGESYGFGVSHAHLPQPASFSRTAVAAQLADPGSTLRLYREALRLRRELQTAEELDWVPADEPEVLHFVRPGGRSWHCVTNFGTDSGGPAGRDGAGGQRAAGGRCAARRDDGLAERPGPRPSSPAGAGWQCGHQNRLRVTRTACCTGVWQRRQGRPVRR